MIVYDLNSGHREYPGYDEIEDRRGGGRGRSRRAVRSTTVIFLQPVIYFGRAFPNWRVWVIPAIAISGFHAFVSKNPIRFSDGSMSNW